MTAQQRESPGYFAAAPGPADAAQGCTIFLYIFVLIIYARYWFRIAKR
jgi:hypothetical protein